MKVSSNLISLFAVPGMLWAGVTGLSAADCDEATANIAKLKDDPAEVVQAVAKELAKSEDCVCEIVTAAVEAVDGDKDVVGQIVVAAVTALPNEATRIVECAVAGAPDAADAIQAAIRETFNYGEAYGKQPVVDKGVIEEVVEEDLFAKVPVDVRGIYLIPPISPSAAFVDAGREEVIIVRDRVRTVTRTHVITVPSPSNPRPTN
jgi:hypothetical protein